MKKDPTQDIFFLEEKSLFNVLAPIALVSPAHYIFNVIYFILHIFLGGEIVLNPFGELLTRNDFVCKNDLDFFNLVFTFHYILLS